MYPETPHLPTVFPVTGNKYGAHWQEPHNLLTPWGSGDLSGRFCCKLDSVFISFISSRALSIRLASLQCTLPNQAYAHPFERHGGNEQMDLASGEV